MRQSSRIALLLAVAAATAFAADPAPAKKKLTLQDLINSTSGSSSNKTASVAGVRGLDETNGDIDTKARDYAAIERLGQVVVHEEEVKKFLEEGKLK